MLTPSLRLSVATAVLSLSRLGCAGGPSGSSGSGAALDPSTPPPTMGSPSGAPGSMAQGSPTPDGGAGAPAPAPASAHAHCGWIFTSDPTAAAAFTAHADWYQAIHPDWFALQPDGVAVRDLADVDDPAIVATAQQHHVALIPLVASVDDVAYTRAMMRDPQKRAAHIATLVQLATARGYAGLDLDYEHLWAPADAAPLAAFLDEASAAMHAAGKQLSMTAPAIDLDNSPSNATWDYGHMARTLDAVHVMAYDYHTLGTHPGPTSPLGWVDAVAARIAATGQAARFVLGLPNYGVGTSVSCPLATCASLCTAPVESGADEMQSCPNNTDTHYASGTIHRCATASGPLYFDDAASLAEKATSARTHGLAGIGYWNVGNEPPGFFTL